MCTRSINTESIKITYHDEISKDTYLPLVLKIEIDLRSPSIESYHRYSIFLNPQIIDRNKNRKKMVFHLKIMKKFSMSSIVSVSVYTYKWSTYDSERSLKVPQCYLSFYKRILNKFNKISNI